MSAESLEQAAKKFQRDGHYIIGGTYLENAIRGMTEFAAERERQVWAEALAAVVDETGLIRAGGDPNYAILRLMEKFRARGEQVK